jgi:hypothetical protein
MIECRNEIRGPYDERMVRDFVRQRTRLHASYIAEQARTRRYQITLAALLIVLAGAAVLFAPPGRETLSYWVGGALVIFAAGALGFRRLFAKAPGFAVTADQDQR